MFATVHSCTQKIINDLVVHITHFCVVIKMLLCAGLHPLAAVAGPPLPAGHPTAGEPPLSQPSAAGAPPPPLLPLGHPGESGFAHMIFWKFLILNLLDGFETLLASECPQGAADGL